MSSTFNAGDYAASLSLLSGNYVLYWKIDAADSPRGQSAGGAVIELAVVASSLGWYTLTVKMMTLTGLALELDKRCLTLTSTWDTSTKPTPPSLVSPRGPTNLIDDYFSTAQVVPSLDSGSGGQNSILAFAGQQNSSRSYLKWVRKLVTGDSRDKNIPANGN